MKPSETNTRQNPKGVSRRDFLQTAGAAALAMGSGALSLSSAEARDPQAFPEKAKPGGPVAPRPYNVMFILTDQKRYLPGLLGKGHWPGRDRLAKMGTTFENHQICSAVCTPLP